MFALSTEQFIHHDCKVTFPLSMKVLASLLVFAGVFSMVTAELSGDELVSLINNGSHSWRAGHNEISARGFKARHSLGARRLTTREEALFRLPAFFKLSAANVPASFDLRQQYPKCLNLVAIKDQSYCGSCWAVSVASAATDRLCIASSGALQANLSSQELTSCCSYCGEGCDGGWPAYAWYYIRKQGVVTGGDYGSKEGCQPYGVSPCGGAGKPACPSQYSTPRCPGNACTNSAYQKSYAQDKHYASSAYTITPTVGNIQLEIMQKGPVVATMDVYNDFYYYKSGVYRHTYGAYEGGHAVKVLGWGSEGGVDYWLVANSWARTWGENGFFKIRRGTNECNVEQQISAGVMRTT